MNAKCDFCGAPADAIAADGRWYCGAHRLVGLVRARQGKASPLPPTPGRKPTDWAKASDDQDDDAADAGAEGAAG